MDVPFATLKKDVSLSLARELVHLTSLQIQLAALRAAEIEADAILMAKNGVDGVYNADPKKDKTAVKFEELTHRDVINKGLRIMDSTASTLSMDNDIDLVVFNMNQPGNIKRVVFGENIGTTVSNNIEEKE